jgi:hypothetical protein
MGNFKLNYIVFILDSCINSQQLFVEVYYSLLNWFSIITSET